MATGDVREIRNDQGEYVFPVGSRISWGAILAGAAVAFAVYFLLNLLGVAIGFSVLDDVDADSLGIGAAIWAIVTVLISLFLGGYVTSYFTLGEDRLEAGIYGAVLWGVLFVGFIWMAGMGMSMGFNTLLGLSGGQTYGMDTGATAGDELDAGVRAEQAREIASQAAWWAFVGTILSMAASIGGAVAGAAVTAKSDRRVRRVEVVRTGPGGHVAAG